MSSREQYDAAQQHEWERAAGVQLGRCERAEALVARYRAALEAILERSEYCEACPSIFQGHPASWCATCLARDALKAAANKYKECT